MIMAGICIIFKRNILLIHTLAYLRQNCRRVRSFVLPGGRELLFGLVISGKTVDARLDQNKAEFRVLVLAVGLEVLTDSNRLLHQEPQVLGDSGSQAYGNVSTIKIYDKTTALTYHSTSRYEESCYQ